MPQRNVPALAKKIEKLIIDSELRISMGKEGRLRIKNVYSEDNFIRRLGEVFRELDKLD